MKRVLLCACAAVLLGIGTTALVYALTDAQLIDDTALGDGEGVPGTFLLIFISMTGVFFAAAMFVTRLFELSSKGWERVTWVALYRVVFVACCNALFFVLFGLGRDAAQFLHSQSAQYGVFCTSVYFLFLCALMCVTLFAGVVCRVCSCTFWQAASHGGAIVLLIAAVYGISNLPGWDNIPFISYNLTFSIALTLVVCAPWLLDMVGAPKERNRE